MSNDHDAIQTRRARAGRTIRALGTGLRSGRTLARGIAGVCATAVCILLVSPAGALAESQEEFHCTSDGWGWSYCHTMGFAIDNCRTVGARNLDSGDNRWIKVQVRKGDGDTRWESGQLHPGDAENGHVAGADRFTPRIYINADGLTRTGTTIRVQFTGC
jgi:hypothetical protein